MNCWCFVLNLLYLFVFLNFFQEDPKDSSSLICFSVWYSTSETHHWWEEILSLWEKSWSVRFYHWPPVLLSGPCCLGLSQTSQEGFPHRSEQHTWHILGSYPFGSSQTPTDPHWLHGFIWSLHPCVHSAREAADAAISSERGREDGGWGWGAQGFAGVARGGDRTGQSDRV